MEMVERNFQQMANILPCGYLVTSGDGRIIVANKFILSLLRRTEYEVLNKTRFQDFLPIEGKIYFETHLWPWMNLQETVEEVSMQLLRFDKQLIPVLVNAVMVKDSLGAIEYVQYTFFDISQRKKYETDLLESSQRQDQLINELTKINKNYRDLTLELERKKNIYKNQSEIYQQISDIGRVGGWELNLVTGNLYWSEVTKKIHELDENEDYDAAKSLIFFKEGINRDTVQEAVKEAIRSGIPFDLELQIITKKNREVWVRVNGFTEIIQAPSVDLHEDFRDYADPVSSDKTIRLYGTFQDIDKEKKMMLQLEQSNIKIQKDNTYYKSLIENHSFYITKTDLKGHYTYLNPFFCETMGIVAEEWLGRNSFDLLISEDHKACTETIKNCMQEPNKSHTVILRKLSSKGILVNQWELKLLTDQEGRNTEFLCIGHEITPLIKKQHELQALAEVTAEQNKRLINFTYIISHNIRSHVANLKGIINLTEFDQELDGKITGNLMKDSVYRLDETIHNLNEIISIQANTNLPLNTFSITKEIEHVVKSIQLLISSSKTTINYSFSAREKLTTNPAYFESIILNLITNAIKYKRPECEPVLDFSLEYEPNYKILVLKDNGMGIDVKKFKDQLFGMYNTFHGNKDAKGLGLFITKTQIEAINGKISIESEVGCGTKFKVFFPLKP